MGIIKDNQEKIGKDKSLPALMKLLSSTQTIAAVTAFSASKKGDVKTVEANAK